MNVSNLLNSLVIMDGLADVYDITQQSVITAGDDIVDTGPEAL